MEIIFKPRKELHEVKVLTPEKSCFDNKVTIRRRTRYFKVTDTAWDMIRTKLQDKYGEDKVTEVNDGKDLVIYEELELPDKKDEKK